MGKPIEAVLVKKGHQDDTVPYAVLVLLPNRMLMLMHWLPCTGTNVPSTPRTLWEYIEGELISITIKQCQTVYQQSGGQHDWYPLLDMMGLRRLPTRFLDHNLTTGWSNNNDDVDPTLVVMLEYPQVAGTYDSVLCLLC